MKNNTLISVIITTKNEEDVLEQLLVSLTKQSQRNLEIIVVDNNSGDKTKKIAQKYTPNVYNKGPERSSQRNYGAKQSRGKYLLFLDADMELSRDVIKECLIKISTDTKIGGVIIPEISIGKRFWEKIKSFERSFYFVEGSYLTDSARFFIKKAFRDVSGYDESITGTEDWDLSESVRKKGYKIDRINSAIYHHERIPSLFKHAKKFYYYGIDSHRTLFKQNEGLMSAKTIHFLRPAFYRQWKKLLSHPILTTGMIIMLFSQMFFGGIGYFKGKFKSK